MLVSKTVMMKWTNKTKTWYIKKGYKFTKQNDMFEVKTEDLTPSSNVIVDCLCDYCLEEGKETIISKKYQDYLKQNNKSIIHKDCCEECKPKKQKESNLKRYGVEHTSMLDSTIEKMKNTNLEKYGCEIPMQNEEIKEKTKATSLDKYGTNTASQNSEIKEKMKNTNLERYGYKSPTLNEKIRNKQLKTMKDKYGVEYCLQSEEISKKIKQTLYSNGNGVCSRQQKYISNLLNGELNFPFNNLLLDIAFPDEKIYIECDFGGHELQVKLGNITQKEFEEQEKRRWYILYRNGWKEIRIISKTDKIPSDEVLNKMISFAKYYLLVEKHSYIKFDIDNKKVICSQFEKNYDFEKLRRIYN